MRDIWRPVILVCAGWLLTVGFVQAGGERVTVMMDGDSCAESQAAVKASLSTMPGVKAIDLETVPGHALIDVDADRLTPEQVATAVNKVTKTGERCTVEVMKSCISTMVMK